jgi:hypothetical protein
MLFKYACNQACLPASGLSRYRAASSIEQTLAAQLEEAFHMKIFGFDLLLNMVTGDSQSSHEHDFPKLFGPAILVTLYQSVLPELR